VARPWPGGEKRSGRRASHHKAFEAIGAFLLLCAATGVSLLAVWCLSGATPRGQPWTPAVTLPQRCDGLSARRMAVLWTCRKPSLGRHVHRAFLRNAWLDFTPIIAATACHQRNDVETYSRSKPWATWHVVTPEDRARQSPSWSSYSECSGCGSTPSQNSSAHGKTQATAG
jgi:hypothetical protein